MGYGFVEGEHWASDIARIEPARRARDKILFALQDLLLFGNPNAVSDVLGDNTDIRYVRSREFPSLEMPPLYMTFRFETADLIELRRIVTEADVRAGFFLEA